MTGRCNGQFPAFSFSSLVSDAALGCDVSLTLLVTRVCLSRGFSPVTPGTTIAVCSWPDTSQKGFISVPPSLRSPLTPSASGETPWESLQPSLPCCLELNLSQKSYRKDSSHQWSNFVRGSFFTADI